MDRDDARVRRQLTGQVWTAADTSDLATEQKAYLARATRREREPRLAGLDEMNERWYRL